MDSKWKIYRVLAPSVGGQGGGTITEILHKAVLIERTRFAHAAGKADSGITHRTDLEYRYMVPGLAQRNGSVYSVVLFVSPHELELPESGFVFSERFYTASADLMIAQELTEAVSFANSGLLKRDAVAVVNEHRVMTSVEKMPVTKDLVKVDDQVNAIKRLVGTYIGINAHELALSNAMKFVYANTILLGALCASSVLPISKRSFLDAIQEKFSGNTLRENMIAFEIGYQAVTAMREGKQQIAGDARYQGIREVLDRNYRRVKSSRGKADAERYLEFMDKIRPSLPDNVANIYAEGVGQLIDFEGWQHANIYTNNVMEMVGLDKQKGNGSFNLSQIYAKHLAGRLMKWEGPFEVARIKCRNVPPAKSDSLLKVEALLQPNVEEMYGMVPKGLHDFICRVYEKWPEYIEKKKYDGKPMSIDMTSIGGYLKLWILWKFSFMHKYSVRYHKEITFVKHYTDTVKEITKVDYELGCLVADYAQYIRGFSFVRARNIDAFNTLVNDILLKAVEMDRALGNNNYRIARSAFIAARNLITLDGMGKDKALALMDEARTLFDAKEYDRLYQKLELRSQLTLLPG